MGKSAKPRQTKRPRDVRLPMQAPARDKIATQMHLTVEALILAPSPDSYNRCVAVFAVLDGAGVACAALKQAQGALTGVCSRFERTGRVGVSDAEAAALRAATAVLDPALALVPLNNYIASSAVVERDLLDMGA